MKFPERQIPKYLIELARLFEGAGFRLFGVGGMVRIRFWDCLSAISTCVPE
jgi:hypothetical protein